jgi:hypothetical protein
MVLRVSREEYLIKFECRDSFTDLNYQTVLNYSVLNVLHQLYTRKWYTIQPCPETKSIRS